MKINLKTSTDIIRMKNCLFEFEKDVKSGKIQIKQLEEENLSLKNDLQKAESKLNEISKNNEDTFISLEVNLIFFFLMKKKIKCV